MPLVYYRTYRLSPGRSHRSTNQPRRQVYRSADHCGYNDLLRRFSRFHDYGFTDEDHACAGPSNDVIDSPHQPSRAPAPKPHEADAATLKVESVDFQVRANTAAHRTNEYDITEADRPSPQLVVRRGQPFDIRLTFNRPYDANKDDLRLVFQCSDNPMPSKGTHVDFVLSAVDLPKQWGAKIKDTVGKTLDVTVFTPPDCFVAKWRFKVDVVRREATETAVFRYNHKDPIYILFNPWCKDDMVYMEDTNLLKEYIMNETGAIYAGTSKRITGKPWNFAQFAGNVLDCSLYLLDISGLNWAVRGNPILVVRKLSSMVNAPDDGGLLVGNWSGNYEGGSSPLSWTGSQAILEDYYANKKPVKYGQCWVFSGVTTSVCRALGIPARSVTNFASAHDSDGSISIDVHFLESGEADESKNSDSVWNFHVWNEVWMARPDLPKGYGGWQAVDATPQETSDGVYCCGPASVEAIKNGEVNLPYDAPFVFAEVNADKVYWVCYKDGRMENCQVNKHDVGKNISTKMPNSFRREDVTNHYKYPEDSNEERVAVLKANQVGSSRHDLYKKGEQDMEFDVEDPDVFFGDDVYVILKMHNKGSRPRRVRGRVSTLSMYYTGVAADVIKADEFDVTVDAGKDGQFKLCVAASDYDGRLKDMCMLRLNVLARVEDTQQFFTHQDELRLRKPHLTLKVLSEATVGKALNVDVSFVNPLDRTLTGCFLNVEGPGLQEPLKIPQPNVGAKQTFKTTVELTPRKTGPRDVNFSFNSREIEDVNGSATIMVKGK